MKRAKVIAVGFDGSLCSNEYPCIGKANDAAICHLLSEQLHGAKIILWTCREGERLAEALEWCKRHGLTFDAVNENLPEMIEEFGSDPRKIIADEYREYRCLYSRSGKNRHVSTEKFTRS